jgi:hypothetical protein
VICKPAAVSGEEIAARATHLNPFATSREPAYTRSFGNNRGARHTAKTEDDDE